MQFVFPAFLTALLALAIPVVIHLFYFRRFKKVYFTNVRFLKEVKEETSNRRRLRNLLVLAMRCLALSLLVLAFAQPFLPKSDAVKQGERAVSIFIDNSFSMGALSEQSPLIELAKQRARDIVSAHGPADRFQIITNELEGRDQRLISKDDALTRIEEVRSGSATRQLSKVLTRQQQALATGTSENQKAYLISDFQKNVSDLELFKDSLLAVDLVPMRAVQESNISIDSAWFESPVQVLNQPARLMVRISNRGTEAADEVRLSFWHDGQLKPVGTLSVPAGAQKVDTVNFNILHPGWHQARLSITDFPVQFDDDYYINFQVAERIEVLSINAAAANPYLNRAFAGAGFFRLENTDVRALDYSQFNRYQLILLNELTTISTGLSQELQQFVRNGGNVLVFPARQADLNSYNAFLQAFGAAPLGGFESTPREGAQLNTESFVFNDVYLNKSANLRLPKTQGNFKLPPNRGEYLISYRDGAAQLAGYALGEGDLFVFAAPLDEQGNDLVRNGEVFVPMLFRMAVAGLKSQQVAHTIGTDEVLEASHTVSAAGEMVYRLQLLKNDKQPEGAEFIPEQRILGNRVLLTPGSAVRDAGWYGLFLRQDSTLSQYAFNYDRRESELTFRSTEELKSLGRPNWNVLDGNARTNFAQVVDEQNQGIVLWRWCLVFALLFLALEGLFLRLWKV
jgi:hypothetical protein